MLKPMATRSCLGLLVILAGCGDLDGPSANNANNANNTNNDNGDGLLESTTEGGVTTTRVNATSEEIWVYLDLESGEEVEPTDPATSSDWDIAFQRFKVKVNGGISGDAGVEVAQIEGADFDALDAAPADGFVTDRADGEDNGEIADFAISIGPSSETGPWNYDLNTHTLSGSDFVFVIRSAEDAFFKARFTEYYNDVGDPGWVVMEYAPLSGQDEPGVLRFETSGGWTYLSMTEGGVVEVDGEATSTDWDLAASRVAWKTNSGDGYAGQGGARVADSAWDDLTETSTSGFTEDAEIAHPSPPFPMIHANAILSDWFDYDPQTHEVTSKGEVYVVRGATGSDYAKLEIVSYVESEGDGSYEVRLEMIPAVE